MRFEFILTDLIGGTCEDPLAANASKGGRDCGHRGGRSRGEEGIVRDNPAMSGF